MLVDWEELPPFFVTSAEKKIGREEILSYIAKMNLIVKTGASEAEM